MKIMEKINLLYPDVISERKAQENRIKCRKMPSDYIENLELKRVAMMIMPQNPDRIINLFTEMNEDISVTNYRLDCVEDFLNQSVIMEQFRQIIRKISDNNQKINEAKHTENSFVDISIQIECLKEFVKCVAEVNIFYSRCEKSIKSTGLKNLFEFFSSLSVSDEYTQMQNNLNELSDVISHSIRSVKVGINFTKDMVPDVCGILEVGYDKIYPKDNVLDRFIFKTAKNADKFVDKQLENTDTHNECPDINTALFRALDKYTKEYSRRVSASLRSYQDMFFSDINELEHQLDLYEGEVRLIRYVRSRGLWMSRPEMIMAESRKMFLENCFDICLFRQASNVDFDAQGENLVVTNDFSMDANGRFYMLSGANNGGKTTFARGIGICQILAQAGFYVPASHAEISPCDFVFTHFPQEEKVGINSSRFTTEIKQLCEICNYITPQSMVILNESIQSTTPDECVKIAGEHLEIFAAAGVRGIFVTHLNNLYGKAEEINNKKYRTKISSIIETTDEKDGRRLYKIRLSPPRTESLAQAVFNTYGARLELVMSRIKRSQKEAKELYSMPVIK